MFDGCVSRVTMLFVLRRFDACNLGPRFSRRTVTTHFRCYATTSSSLPNRIVQYLALYAIGPGRSVAKFGEGQVRYCEGQPSLDILFY